MSSLRSLLLMLVSTTLFNIFLSQPSFALNTEPLSRSQECLANSLSLNDCIVPALANSETDLDVLSSRFLNLVSSDKVAGSKLKKEKFELDRKIWKQHRDAKCDLESFLSRDDQESLGDEIAQTELSVCRLKLNEERIEWLLELSTAQNSSSRAQSFSAHETPKTP